MDDLLERSAELSAIRASAEHAAAGRGRALVVEAPAGIGKTALVSAARTLAREAGLRTFGARGTELESAFGFGVVRPADRADRGLGTSDPARRRPPLPRRPARAARRVVLRLPPRPRSGRLRIKAALTGRGGRRVVGTIVVARR